MTPPAASGSPAENSPTSDIDAMIDAVGPRLRQARQDKGLTLNDVASDVAISTSTLSRLESGGRRPTLDLLIVLARIYGVALDDLVGAPPTGDPRIHPRPIHRHGRVFVPLTSGSAPVKAVKMVLPGREPGTPIERNTHQGYEWLYVLSGSVDLAIGPDVTTLQTGEAAEFDTFHPHGIVSATREPAEVLGLFSADGARIHIRADE